jgi:hypothetical protein
MFSTNTFCTQLKLNDSYFTGNSHPKLKSIHHDASRGLGSSFSKYRKGCNFLTYHVLWWTVLNGCCPDTYFYQVLNFEYHPSEPSLDPGNFKRELWRLPGNGRRACFISLTPQVLYVRLYGVKMW